jgi:hypothetical protein
LGGHPGLQINVDATAMVQAGLGSGYAQQIVTNEVNDFLSNAEGVPLSTANLDVRIAFNPNITTTWFTSVMGIINSISMLAINRHLSAVNTDGGAALDPFRILRAVDPLSRRRSRRCMAGICRCRRNRQHLFLGGYFAV